MAPGDGHSKNPGDGQPKEDLGDGQSSGLGDGQSKCLGDEQSEVLRNWPPFGGNTASSEAAPDSKASSAMAHALSGFRNSASFLHMDFV